ncbi:hypothetical protein NHG23_06395 [Aerococcaceae bacterium NML190073]|nr:hypothetical protein [Aerococcaceae bacterium NML190073]MCW6665906.1 hypothetical protein [Aerococcaceae bacterium NML191219]
MSSNSSGWIWLLLMLIGGLSSLFEKWSKHQKEEPNRINQHRHSVSTLSANIVDEDKGSHTYQLDEWETDVEMPIAQSLHNQRQWRQQRQSVSENEETDFGEELAVDPFEMETDLQEARVAVANQPQPRNRRRLIAKNIRQAILYQEILAKPKSLR